MATTYNLRLRTQRFNFTRPRSTARRISKTKVQRGGNNLLICAANKITRFIFVRAGLIFVHAGKTVGSLTSCRVSYPQYCQKYSNSLAACRLPLAAYRLPPTAALNTTTRRCIDFAVGHINAYPYRLIMCSSVVSDRIPRAARSVVRRVVFRAVDGSGNDRRSRAGEWPGDKNCSDRRGIDARR